MCTLCLCDMGELHDEWLRAAKVVVGPLGCAEALVASVTVDVVASAKVAQEPALAAGRVAEAA